MEQSIRLIAATETTPGIANELRDWFEAEFGPRADRWRGADYYVLLNRDTTGRASRSARPKVSVGNRIIRVGGIGGVATKPEFRHRGVAGAMLSRAAEFMNNCINVPGC